MDEKKEMHLRALVAALDGTQIIREEIRATVNGGKIAHDLGDALGKKLKARLPAGFLA